MKKKRIQRKQSINLKFISVLTLVGVMLIIISYFDYDGKRIGAGSFEDEKLLNAAKVLLDDPEVRFKQGKASFKLLEEYFSVTSAAKLIQKKLMS